MKTVWRVARVDAGKCTGCGTCRAVCPVLAIEVVGKVARVDEAQCLACSNCEQRCPEHAIEMAARGAPITVGVDPSEVDQDAIKRICAAAHIHPEQVVCFCLRTRADEVVAAILKGAATPEEVSRMTGVRTGCAVLCIHSVLRLLQAAGIRPRRPRGFQWYGGLITLWDIPDHVKEKYASAGYHIDEDREIMARVYPAPVEEGVGE